MESNRYIAYLGGINTSTEGSVPSLLGKASTTVSPASVNDFSSFSPSLSSPSSPSTNVFNSPALHLRPNATLTTSPAAMPRQKRGVHGGERSEGPQSLEIKRKRNCIAASKCRAQAMKRQQNLQENARLLEQQHVNLVNTVEALRDELSVWKTAMHGWKCAAECGNNCDLRKKLQEFEGTKDAFQDSPIANEGQSTLRRGFVDNKMDGMEGLLMNDEALIILSDTDIAFYGEALREMP